MHEGGTTKSLFVLPREKDDGRFYLPLIPLSSSETKEYRTAMQGRVTDQSTSREWANAGTPICRLTVKKTLRHEKKSFVTRLDLTRTPPLSGILMNYQIHRNEVVVVRQQ